MCVTGPRQKKKKKSIKKGSDQCFPVLLKGYTMMSIRKHPLGAICITQVTRNFGKRSLGYIETVEKEMIY